MSVKFTKLAFETNFNKHELACLHKCFQDAFHKPVISRENFVDACSKKGVLPFFAGRLFDVFSVQAIERGVNDGMDFEVYANIVSAFSPNAPMEEKMFVCFKLFDLKDTNHIDQENLEVCLGQLEIAALNADHIRLLASRTLEQAHATDGKITFQQFQGMFLHSPILLLLFTMETWSVMNLSLRRSFGIKFSSFSKHFSKSRKASSAAASPYNSSVLETQNSNEGFAYLRSPSLRQRFENLLKGSIPSTDSSNPQQSGSGNDKDAGEGLDDDDEVIVYETGFSTLETNPSPEKSGIKVPEKMEAVKKFEQIAENENLIQ